MLRSILLLLSQHRRQGTMPDFAVLRAMLFYMDEFPEQRHHLKESSLLFPKLRSRSAEAEHVLERLDQEHARGEAAIRELEHALLAFEMMGEARREAFEQAMQRYADFYFQHMAVEEKQVLPLAERVLLPQDWAELDAAFAANRDPLTGHEPEDDYRDLFRRIVNALPAPRAGRRLIRARSAGRRAKLVAARLPNPTLSRRVSAPTHIAILDDEVDITRLLAGYLQAQGFRVTQLHDGAALMDIMQLDPPALVLLDLGLPGEDGFSIARRLREHWRCGLVIVSGRGDAVDKVVGLEVGADDYVTKPFDLRELLARIKAVLRRLTPADPPAAAAATDRQRLRFAGWLLDIGARRLFTAEGATSR